MTSKEIGRELGISPHTVDVHIKAAMKTLHVPNRAKAALLFIESEENFGSELLVNQSPGVAEQLISKHLSPDSGVIGGDIDYSELDTKKDDSLTNTMHDATANYGESRFEYTFASCLPVSEKKEKSFHINQLSIPKRLIVIIVINFTSIVMFLIFISAFQILSSLYE